MKDCFAYIRVSTLKQGEEGVSLKEQRSAIESYAAKHSFSIIEWFEETITAAKKGRPKFTDMMKRLRGKDVEAVIIHKIDRSTRNLKDWSDIGDLVDAGIDVRFANESLDLTTRSGRLTADILAVFASDYIRNLRIETDKGFYGRLKEGIYPLKAPPGYLDQGKGKTKTPDPKTAPTIKKLFSLYATGEYSIPAIRHRLQPKGVNGQVLSINSISKILNNPFYYGLIHIKKRDEYFQGIHKPLISKKTYDRVQLVLRGKCAAKFSKHNYLFKRLFKCTGCNRSLIAEKQKGFIYYRCHNKDCPVTSLREEKLDEAVRNLLARIRLPECFLEYLIQESKRSWNEALKVRHLNDHSAKLNLAKMNDRLGRLTDAYVNGQIDQRAYSKRQADLSLEKEELEKQAQRKEQNFAHVQETIVNFLELTKSLISTYDQGDIEKKREIIKTVTSNRTVSAKNVDLEPSKWWAYMQNRNVTLSCTDAQGNFRTFTKTEIKDIGDEILEDLKQIAATDSVTQQSPPL